MRHPRITMRLLRYLAAMPLIAAAAAASLPASTDALNTLNTLLGRHASPHASGCSHSSIWQGDAETSSARACNNGSSLVVVDSSPSINKTDCQALVNDLNDKTGQGHWDIQWNCDGNMPNVLASSNACGFAIDKVTESNENTIDPQDLIEIVSQAMNMFPNNDTMHAVTGSTVCNNVADQTINWRVGPRGTASSAGMVQPRWGWLCLVGTLAAVLSLQCTF